MSTSINILEIKTQSKCSICNTKEDLREEYITKQVNKEQEKEEQHSVVLLNTFIKKVSIKSPNVVDIIKSFLNEKEIQKKITICNECYHKEKCSICCELFDGKSHKLHEDVDCCKEIKLCKICKDSLKKNNITACPLCRYDIPKQLIKYICDASREYFLINERDYLRWITTSTTKSYQSFYYNTNYGSIPLEYLIQNEVSRLVGHFYSFQFNYIRRSDQDLGRLLMRIYYYCSSNCSTLHHLEYEFSYSPLNNSQNENYNNIVNGNPPYGNPVEVQ